MGCFTTVIAVVGFIFVMLTALRWFEQITEAVDLRWWNRVIILIAAPFSVWFFPSRIAAGRPTPFPLHEPVRGFGTLPKTKAPVEAPPPDTPPEFLGLPKIPPPRPKGAKPTIDPEQIEKLRRKMREQGMRPPESDE